eukprot:Protomagalhaensia_sp_Gyna_25__4634@NODE_42_length_6385_cov_204_458714_g31_i0_p3_GENE_NODE_42_length_6385_cov_204_458714_g31_i0NODE_42_length_6385_cov_204_458714_g31_i0_p3_ORF_typecomplete_len377_score13_38Arrestin_N/PF00339_29/2_3e13Arrestin_N/PF00339_29/9_3e03Arrestin_C/PF02752_22/0_0026_NODE_42_length_6385_cov_204_458714_g31_i07111841
MSKKQVRILFDNDLSGGTAECPTFRLGGRITGKVAVSLARKCQVNEISLTFGGRYYAAIERTDTEVRRSAETARLFTGTRHYRETIQLCEEQHSVFKGPIVFSPGQHTFRFALQLPAATSEDEPLPPSLWLLDPGYPQAAVTYTVTVHVFPEYITNHYIVALVPCCLGPVPRSPPEELAFPRQSWRSRRLRPRPLSMKQRFGHLCLRNPLLRTPRLTFDAVAHVPISASIWDPLDTFISLQQQVDGATDPVRPALYLDHCLLQLKSVTVVRVSGACRDCERDFWVIERSIPGNQTVLPLDGRRRSVTSHLRLADLTSAHHRLPPSFVIYGIEHSYQLRLTAVVVHKDTGHTFWLELDTPFTITPVQNGSPTSGGKR